MEESQTSPALRCPVCRQPSCPYFDRPTRTNPPNANWQAGEASETVKAWHRDLHNNLKNISTPPKVSKSTFRDARKMFGANFETKVTLRSPGQLAAHEELVLLEFDPNFTSTEVVCRHPSCNNKNPAAATSGKRDLYLCPNHRQVLSKVISDAMAKENVTISTSAEKPDPGHFAGYTSLIGLLEGAYHDAKEFQTLKGKSPLVQEAILNARNFLIITSTVLNPDLDNLAIILPCVVQIVEIVLKNIPSLVESLVYLLQKVMDMILDAFGVIYQWVSLALSKVSPGAQIGAGMGGFIGALATLATPWTGGVAVVTGATLGGFIGNGIYNLMGGGGQMPPERVHAGGARPNRQPNPMFKFEGDASGGLDASFVSK